MQHPGGRSRGGITVTHSTTLQPRRWRLLCAALCAGGIAVTAHAQETKPFDVKNTFRNICGFCHEDYGRKAGEKVERAMHERKRGQLRSGRSGKKVTSRKQAIAIGLSEARRSGAKVPRRSSRKK